MVVEALPRVVRPVTLRVDESVVAPVTVSVFATDAVLRVAVEAKRFVDEAVVAKKLVVVAEVPVAFTKVKFWRVLDPVARRLARVVSPVKYEAPETESAVVEAYGKTLAPVAVEVMIPAIPRVPVKLAADEIVWLLMRPEVSAPVTVAVSSVAFDANRLVEDAVVAKDVVVVALVVVEFRPVKFWRVLDPVARRLARVVRPVKYD